jgi:beta-galactosidase
MGEAVHGVFYRAGYAVGVVRPDDALAGLKLYVIPHLALFDPSWVPALEAFVAGGGTLVIGARTACKDLNNNVVAATLPGVLRGLVGATVEEYGRQNRPAARPLALRFTGCNNSADTPTELWYEQLAPDLGTEVLATWTTRHLAGQAAITAKRHGAGQVIYVGTYLTQALTAALLPVLEQRGALPARRGPGGEIETVLRQAAALNDVGRRAVWRFLINHADEARTVLLPGAAKNWITDEWIEGSLTLAANGVAVLEENALA